MTDRYWRKYILTRQKRVTLRLRSQALHNLRREYGRWKTRNGCDDNCSSLPSPSSSVSASFLPPSAAKCTAVLCHSKIHFCPPRSCRLRWQSEGGDQGSHGRGGRGRGRRGADSGIFLNALCIFIYLFILGSVVGICGLTGRNLWGHRAVLEVALAGNLVADEAKKGSDRRSLVVSIAWRTVGVHLIR